LVLGWLQPAVVVELDQVAVGQVAVGGLKHAEVDLARLQGIGSGRPGRHRLEPRELEAVVLLSATLADANPTVLALATAIGLLAALVQFLGLVRWPFAVPHLARLAGDPATTPATRDAVEVTFQTLNRYLGVAVGEHLGYLFTGLWTALAGIALIQSDLLHPLFGVVGPGLAPLFALGSLEFVGPFEPGGWKLAGNLVPLAYIGWSVWLLALGISLMLTA
jgi:hypothetical protein